MGKGLKKLYWVGAGATFLLALFLSLAVITPKVVDSVWLKEIVQTEAAKQLNGKLDFQKAEIFLLPSPSIALQQVSLQIPPAVQINVNTLRVYPKLLPLLIGNIDLAEIVLDQPDFSLPFPGKLAKKPDQKKSFNLSETLETASAKLSSILTAVSGLDVGAHKGTLRLFAGDNEIFLLENINSRLAAAPRSLTISISCKSNIWESMKLEAKLAPGHQKGNGKITLEKISGKTLTDYFLPGKPSGLDGSISSLQADFTVHPEVGITADIQSSNASFSVPHQDKEINAIIENFAGNIKYNDQRRAITVENLTLSYPGMQLSGSLNLNNTVSHASLDIKAQNSDIRNLRVVLPAFTSAFFGHQPVVQDIFSIMRGGTISEAAFNVSGKSLGDLAIFESMQIRGHAENVDISLAELGLDLHGVAGDVIIAKGILEGKNLTAGLGNTTGTDGTFRLGLVKKETTPFFLDLQLNANLPDVPPLLKRLVPQKQLHEFLALIEIIEGTARGRLTLGESLQSLAVRAEVDSIFTHVRYKPVPYLVKVDRGRIIYDGLKTELHGLQGTVGTSTFANYSSSLDFTGEPTIDVQSGNFQMVLDEILPWLASFQRLAEELQHIQSISGTADLTVNDLKGPLLQPAKLQYELQGTMKNITLNATKLPAPLNIKNGQLAIEPDKLTFHDLHAVLLDSSFTYSGVLQHFISGTTNAEIIVTNAEIDEQVHNWIIELLKTPKEYVFRTPLLISRVHAKWTRDELLDLQGDFSIKKGPLFSLDLMLNPDGLVLRNLAIKNGADQALIKLDLGKSTIGAQFQGILSKKTIDKILLYRGADHHAWIKGDFRINIDRDSLADTTASGNLNGGDFIFPLKHDKLLRLDSYALAASDKTIHLNSSEVVFGENNFSISGAASLSQDRISVDLEVKTDTIELDTILEEFQDEEKVGEVEIGGEKQADQKIAAKEVKKSWNLAFDASLNLHADSLLYNGFSWKPFTSKIIYTCSYLGIEVLEAEICHISTPGKISFHEGKIALDFQVESKDQDIRKVLICLDGGDQQMTGNLNLKARVIGQGTGDTLVNSLQGNLQLRAEEGYIYQDAQVAKLLYFLNVTNMFKGKIPDLRTSGFHYNSLMARGALKRGILTVSPAMLDAPIMEIATHGTIDIPGKRVNLQVLVAPVQTLNKIQKMLPLISKIVPSSLVAVPVEVYGDFSDIKVRAMSLSAISKNVFGIMVDALSAPVRVLEEKPVR